MLGLASGGGPDANLRAPSPGLLRQRSSVPRELSGHENHSKSEPHSLETRLRGPLRAPSGPKDGAAGHARGAAARAAEATFQRAMQASLWGAVAARRERRRRILRVYSSIEWHIYSVQLQIHIWYYIIIVYNIIITYNYLALHRAIIFWTTGLRR